MVKKRTVLPEILTIWQKLNKFLFEPHPAVIEVGAKREARLLSVINLLFALSGLAGAVSIYIVNGLTRNVFVLVFLAVIASAAYKLARTPNYQIGSYLIVWALVFVTFGVGDASRLTDSLHINLVLAFLVASISFPFRYMLFFTILNNLAICLMPFIYPEFTEVGANLGLFIPLSLLTLAAMHHRSNVEKERLTEFKQFNQELTILKNDLEQRVDERTARLEERARQLQVVTEVARAAASFQDLDRLLTSSTRLISESFGFYHVGIFLLNEDGQYVTLHAANSEGGQRMLARMHTLPVDLNSVVGYTAKTYSPRIAFDTGTDSVFFQNPDLPETRSEMAVPLKVGMRLIGVLDVQSTEKNAFSDDDIVIIGTLGDQLAVAMDNAHMLTETRRALIAAEQTYQRYFSHSWSQFSRRMKQVGYRYQSGKVLPLSDSFEENLEKNGNNTKFSIPLMIRGQNIGLLDIQPTDEKRSWTPGEVALLEAAAERAALALESARLLEDAQRRAARERAISEMANKISSITNIESILRTTVEDLGKQIGGAEVTFELNPVSRETEGRI